MNRTPLLTIAARLALRVLAVMTVVFGVLLALPGCGGAEDEPEHVTKPTPPNCPQQPEVCA